VIGLTIEKLNLSYPDFVSGEFMNPEEFDKNNADIKGKVDEVVDKVNEIDDTLANLKFDQNFLLDAKGVYMHETQILIPSKPLSECRNGWVLVWSDYDKDTRTVNNFDFAFSYVPKFFPTLHSGGWIHFMIPVHHSESSQGHTIKTLSITDTTIKGHGGNDVSSLSSDDAVLRYVFEY
jgi:hypothetical protein